MYIAHPTHGAGTRPNRTQLPTAARKTTLNAGQCVRQPREGRGRNSQAPQKKNKKNNGGGGGREHIPQPPNRPPTPPEAAKPPPPEGTEDRTPKEAQGDHPAKTGNTKPVTAAHREKGTPKHADTHHEKKKASSPARKKGDGGTGTTRPGKGTPSNRNHKAKKNTKKAHKTCPDNPAKKGGAQPRPRPSTHAHTARRNQKRRRASGARTKPHTSHKQAETEAQPRTQQTAGTRGTTPQTVPKHTHPRPQPGLARLTKPTLSRKPDQNTNAAQQ